MMMLRPLILWFWVLGLLIVGRFPGGAGAFHTSITPTKTLLFRAYSPFSIRPPIASTKAKISTTTNASKTIRFSARHGAAAGAARRREDSIIFSPSRAMQLRLGASKSSGLSNHDDSKDINSQPETLQQLAPLLGTILAAVLGLAQAEKVSTTVGSLPVVSRALFGLMLAMGLTSTLSEFERALVHSRIVLVLNAVCCFGAMPLLALLVARVLLASGNNVSSLTTGTVLLGSVSGGQASNLFALLAGGNVSLSVVCTLSTTLLGVVATPLLVQWLLGCRTVAVDGLGVLRSIVSLVLCPILLGLGLGRVAPKVTARITPYCPAIGTLATMVLVAGGAANTASTSSLMGASAAGWKMAVAASVLLPVAGGALAWVLALQFQLSESEKRTLVVEVLSKSPTLAYFLALQHFDRAAAAVPAAAMVSLAVVGAAVACIWRLAIPLPQQEEQ